jgi:hypothetical protein
MRQPVDRRFRRFVFAAGDWSSVVDDDWPDHAEIGNRLTFPRCRIDRAMYTIHPHGSICYVPDLRDAVDTGVFLARAP